MANLFVQIDKPFYFAGDTVHGNIFLNLYETISANEVIVKFKGWESVRWLQERVVSQQERERIDKHAIWNKGFRLRMDSSDSDEDQGEEWAKFSYMMDRNQLKEVRRYTGGRIVAKFTSVLHNFGNNYIGSGQYCFPFSFKTGENYPASFMNKSQDRKSKGRIKYELQAIIRGYNSSKKIAKHKQEVIIRESAEIKNTHQQVVSHVKSCCCINQGVSKIQCYFAKDAYCPGEDAFIYCILNTKQSKVDVTTVKVELINEITYTSKQNHTKKFKQQLLRVEFPGLKKGQEKENQHQVKIVNSKIKNQSLYDIKPTARGLKLQSVYYLRIEAVLNASCTCCSQLPIVNQPILIYPCLPVNYVFQEPPNWKPQLMPQMSFQIAIDAQNVNLGNMSNPYG